MAVCRKCNKSYSIHVLIDGRVRNLQSRKYCLECSPFGSRNRKRIHLENRPGKQCICKTCEKSYFAVKGSGHTWDFCNTCLSKKRRISFKKRCVEYKGGKCQHKDCGYFKCLTALEFHHLNPSQKDFQISSSSTKPWEIIKKELDKCLLVCCRCHREIHET